MFNIYNALYMQGENNRRIIRSVDTELKIEGSGYYIQNWPNKSQIMDYVLKIHIYKKNKNMEIFNKNIIYQYLIQCIFKCFRLKCPKYLIYEITQDCKFSYR